MGWTWLLITVGFMDGALMDKPYINLMYDSQGACEGMLKSMHDKDIQEGRASKVYLTDEHKIYYQHYEDGVLYTSYCVRAMNLNETIDEGFKKFEEELGTQ